MRCKPRERLGKTDYITTGARRVETFAGMFLHAASGLYLTLHRAYDPYSGRWLSRDPIEEAGGINLYGYVQENPVNLIDSFGLAVGDLPPPPPGYNPQTWTPGTRNSQPTLQDSEGNLYQAHPEDNGHWRHWDKFGPNGKPLGRCPANSKKPWPGQKQPPYGDQSDSDPNGDAPPYEPLPPNVQKMLNNFDNSGNGRGGGGGADDEQ